MNRKDLQRISQIRLEESAILLKSGFYNGAYYLAGYSIECAIKACIAKQIKRYEFPNKDLANKSWVHDLEQLIGLAGLGKDLKDEMIFNRDLELNWATVKDWNESVRYESRISNAKAKDFYTACFSENNGILTWIKKRW